MPRGAPSVELNSIGGIDLESGAIPNLGERREIRIDSGKPGPTIVFGQFLMMKGAQEKIGTATADLSVAINRANLSKLID